MSMFPTILVLTFYLHYLLISLVEDTLKLVTFYFRLDLYPLGTILAKISIELIFG